MDCVPVSSEEGEVCKLEPGGGGVDRVKGMGEEGGGAERRGGGYIVRRVVSQRG
jgi:hypothetical protein